MKRFFLFFVSIGIVITFILGEFLQATPIVAQTSPNNTAQNTGQFDSILVDFQETPQVVNQLSKTLGFLSQNFNLEPVLNSEFSKADNVYVMPGDRSVLEKLLQSDLAAQTEFIEPNYIYSTTGNTVNDPEYEKQWNLQQINLEGAWKRGAYGQGITVAVIDTGVSKGPDLNKTDFVKGYDFVNDRSNAQDDNGHGTHVAGTIAQSTNNSYGVAGVSYKAKIMPLKVLSRFGSGTIADIAEAIRFAADNGADVINMSLGGGGDSKLMREAIDYAHKKGVVVIAAAGNEGSSRASYPAYYPNVIAVSAVGPDKTKTSYSNYGDGVDIAAPGGATRSGQENGILQETINPRSIDQFVFKYFQGTSMAAPHVAGVAALIKSRRPNMSPDKVLEVLQKSALPVKDDPSNYYGAGLLDAEKAVKLASPFGFGFTWPAVDWKDIIFKLAIAVIFTGVLVPKGKGFNIFHPAFIFGVILGAIGLFMIKGISIDPIPSAVFQFLGSPIPEMGGAIWNSAELNPLFANCLIPFGLMAVFISTRGLKWVALGIGIGMNAFMAFAIFTNPNVWLLGSGIIAQGYLLVNVLVGSLLTALFARTALDQTKAV